MTIDSEELLATLMNKTRDGALQWRESGREAEYIVRLPDYSVALSINRFTELFNQGSGTQSPVTLQLLLPEGLELAKETVEPEEAEYPEWREFYNLVAEKATKKSQMLSELKRQILAANR